MNNRGLDGQSTSTLLSATQKALRNSEELSRNLFNTMDEGFCIIEMIFDAEDRPVDYRFLEVNAAFEQQSGLHQVVGRRVLEIAPDLKPYWLDFYGNVALTGEPARATNEAEPFNRWFDVHAYRVGEPEKRQVASIFNDISDYKRREAALRESEIRYRSLFDNNMDAIFLTVPDGTITAANPAACRMLAMTEREICAAGRKGVVADDSEQAQALAERTQTGKAKAELTFIRKDGTRLLCDVSSVILADGDSLSPLSFVIARDITDRKRSESALIQSEKLAAVGRLAASIAHEINNPLESVTNLHYLASRSEDLDEVRGYLLTADRELHRVAAISSQTLRFYKQSTSPRPVTFHDLMDSVLSLHKGRLVNSHVDVSERYRATRPVLCFEGEIRQVINNVVGNAIDAMPNLGGRLIIRSRDGIQWRTGSKGLVLAIADNGSGISPSVMDDVFKAFFTTKGMRGTGLGLWISKEIMERHNGTIRIHSSDKTGRTGTVVTLFLPFDALTRSRESTCLVRTP